MNTATIPAETTSVNHGYVVRKPLTPEEQELVTRAWHYCHASLVRMKAKHPMKADSIESAFSQRLVTLIHTFDPDRSSLETWSMNHLRYAVADAARMQYNDVSPKVLRAGRWAGWESNLSIYDWHDSTECMDRRHGRAPYGIIPADELTAPDAGEDRDAADTRDYILRPLSARDREIFVRYADGETMAQIARRLGLSESRVSQIRSAAQPILRKRFKQLCA